MSKETFSIPASPTAQHEFAINAVKLITANATAWQIPTENVTKVNASFADYETKYLITNNRSTQSPAATAARNAAWNILKADIEYIYTHYLLNNDGISSSDKEALHIHQTSGGGAASPAPSTTPIISMTAEGIGSVHLVYSDSSAPGTHYKPDNVAFCELWFQIGGTPPISPDSCAESANISRSHATIQFSPEDRGKTVYVFARWVNRNGKIGPWSGMVTAIVP